MKRTVALLVFLWTVGMVFAAAPATGGTRRFGIFAGANNGGRGRSTLRYAVSDARAMARVFGEMGGIDSADTFLLVEPSPGDIAAGIDRVRKLVSAAKNAGKRTELVFYYSGHSDDESVLLGNSALSYKALRDYIDTVPSDMRIVILDSCASGAFTRAKGGVKTRPFLLDEAHSAQGYAFLTSSSAAEVSQESDAIESSFFTHSLLAGLRGAADTVGDGRVTLNEAYRFAYSETLSKTETSAFGSQHPSYAMQVSGIGDVVLTDVKSYSAGILFASDVAGRISIRDSRGNLVAELSKNPGRVMELGLEAGMYRLTLVAPRERNDPAGFYSATVQLLDNERSPVTLADFRFIEESVIPPRLRGGETEAHRAANPSAAESASDLADDIAEGRRLRDQYGSFENGATVDFGFQLVPGVGTPPSNNRFLLGLIGAGGYDLRGFGFAYGFLQNTGILRGVQLSTVFNIHDGGSAGGVQLSTIFNLHDGGVFRGFQGAGIFNDANSFFSGVQFAGVYNTVGGDIFGVQSSGAFNGAGGNVFGAQVSGGFNAAGGDFSGTQAAGAFNAAGGNVFGAQVSGLFNAVGGNLSGAQFAGAVNAASGEVQGAQFALVNIIGTKNPAGKSPSGKSLPEDTADAAPGVFRETEKTALQFGLVNISSQENTLPFGVVNLVKKGIFRPGIGVDDFGMVSAGLQSGGKNLYSILSYASGVFGKSDDAATNLHILRFGFGWEVPLTPNFAVAVDLSAGNFLFKDTSWPSIIGGWNDIAHDDSKTKEDMRDQMKADLDENLTADYQARFVASYRIARRFGLSGGLSYDYIRRKDTAAPWPTSGLVHWGDDNNMHRIGIFGGLQF